MTFRGDLCGFGYLKLVLLWLWNLINKMENKHLNNKTKKIFTCFHCSQNLTKKSNLVRHINKVHLTKNISKHHIESKCVLCKIDCPKQDLIKHYNLYHDIDVATENLEFHDLTLFNTWKSNVEKDTVSKFIKYNTKQSGTSTIYFYRCHRDGYGKILDI